MKTAEYAEEALKLVDEINAREKSSRTAVFRRLGITGSATTEIARGVGCTDGMLGRIRTEWARVFGKPLPRPVTTYEEGDEDGADAEQESEGEGDDGDQPEAERAPFGTRQKRAARASKQSTATPKRKYTRRTQKPEHNPVRKVARKQAPAPTSSIASELARVAAVIDALGGIDRAERLAAAIGGAL